jgi:group I intron endonuclease
MEFLIDKKLKCGVYKITNIVNGKFYIGSTTGLFKNRFLHHRSQLRHNNHGNQHLQNSWNKYGENNFEFSLVESCNSNNQLDREQYYIDVLNPQYNLTKSAKGTLGYHHTKEAKKKISMAFTGINHPAYSGEYVFYHPNHGFIIDGRISFSKSYNLKKIRIHKLCNGELNQYQGWICLGNHAPPFKTPLNIEEIYYEKIHRAKPIRVFYHKQFGIFIGRITDLMNKFNLKRHGIGGIIEGSRQSNYGWIYLGRHSILFEVPKNLKEIYNKKILKNNNLRYDKSK